MGLLYLFNSSDFLLILRRRSAANSRSQFVVDDISAFISLRRLEFEVDATGSRIELGSRLELGPG